MPRAPGRSSTARATLTRRNNALAINSLQRQVNLLRSVDYGPVQQQVQQWTEKFCSADLAVNDEDVGTNAGEDSTASRQARALWIVVRNDRPLLFDATDFSRSEYNSIAATSTLTTSSSNNF